MAVIIEKNTKILIQGFTGKMGTFHAEEMIRYGSNVVGGVTPGKGGQKFEDKIPVYDSVKDEPTVCYVTGNGLKATESIMTVLKKPQVMQADVAKISAVIGWLYND